MTTFLVNNNDTTKPDFWQQLYGCSKSIALAESALNNKKLTLVITASSQQANELEQEIKLFKPELEVLHFPDWETLAYDYFSPHQDIISNRIKTLFRLASNLKQGLLIVPINTLMFFVSPKSFLLGNTFLFNKGDEMDIERFKDQLVNAGYINVPQVMEHGEYAVRGSIIDLFPMASKVPYRIEFFDEEVESIRSFNPESQLTLEVLDSINLLPAREHPFDKEAISLFRQNFRENFEDGDKSCVVYDSISKGNSISGVEYYLPLFFNQMDSLFDYIGDDYNCFYLGDVLEASRQQEEHVAKRFEQYKHNLERPLLKPEQLILSSDQIRNVLEKAIRLDQPHLEPGTKSGLSAPLPDLENLNRNNLEPIIEPLLNSDQRLIVFVESPGRRELIVDLFKNNEIPITRYDNWQEAYQSEHKFGVVTGLIQQGCVLQDSQILINEAQITGYKPRQASSKSRRTVDSESLIHNLNDLKEGDPIVHIDHGVGRYKGLTTLNINEVDTEFLTLEYQEDDKLYVPVSSLHLIARYSGSASESAPINKLGTDKWQKTRKKAAEKIRDVAAELLEIYAKREAAKGYVTKIDKGRYDEFSSQFPFEETEDQLKAIESIEQDMESARPMDRVVCGDVGFGKTEVAMRAVFLAMDSGKQATVLVPTTLLAQQHYQNFLDRFAEWPFIIKGITRFTPAKEVKQIEADLAAGKIDLVIGTHKLLSKNIKFKNLGLVVIDEEHRFGVKHKEHIKGLRSSVDILTLTATPIPRTLNMGLSGMRDLSIIATAPAQRLAIQTLINEWSDELIVEACQREITRGGQVYFLHNEVKTIERITRNLQELMPQHRIRFAHGQMHERELESVMVDFYHQKFQILVATTIIESGIDVPNANTILINRADKLGLAQLHQIRGRVGRSHHRAYAFLLTPPKSLMTKDAEKRLAAIESMDDLGVGFTLATHDMEIRGAGELLGDEQSGQIQQIGFTLYTELLDRAVKAFKTGKEFNIENATQNPVEVEMHLPALIPSDYVFDVQSRLVFYKRIANAENSDVLRSLKVEMIDRFGLLPDALNNLFRQTELKLKAEPLGITKIDLNDNGGKLEFSAQPNINTEELILMIQKTANIYRLDGQQILRCTTKIEKDEQRFEFAEYLIQRLDPASKKNS